MNFQRAFIAKSFEADVALNSFLASCGVDELDTETEGPRGRRRVAPVRRVLGRSSLIALVVISATEAGAELAEIELRRRLSHSRHHKIVQAGRQAGNRTVLFGFHHVTVIICARSAKRVARVAAALRLRTCDTGDRARAASDKGQRCGGARAARQAAAGAPRGREARRPQVGGASAGRSGSMHGGDTRHSRTQPL